MMLPSVLCLASLSFYMIRSYLVLFINKLNFLIWWFVFWKAIFYNLYLGLYLNFSIYFSKEIMMNFIKSCEFKLGLPIGLYKPLAACWRLGFYLDSHLSSTNWPNRFRSHRATMALLTTSVPLFILCFAFIFLPSFHCVPIGAGNDFVPDQDVFKHFVPFEFIPIPFLQRSLAEAIGSDLGNFTRTSEQVASCYADRLKGRHLNIFNSSLSVLDIVSHYYVSVPVVKNGQRALYILPFIPNRPLFPTK